MGQKTIFVFGLSGVGKTTFCQALVSAMPDLVHFQASSLLQEATGLAPEQMRVSDKNQIHKRQGLLGYILRLKRKALDNRTIIVDGHSVIDNDSITVPVPLETIEAARPTLLVFLYEDPETLKARREAGGKFRPVRSIEYLENQQNYAKSVVEEYGRRLNVPVKIIQPSQLSLKEANAESINNIVSKLGLSI